MKNILYLFISILLIFNSCSEDGSNSELQAITDNNGQGGSLAVFTLKGNYLYTVDNSNLHVFDLTNPMQPQLKNTTTIGFNIETLYSLDQYLFIGSQNGMFIYSIENPEDPEYISEAHHFTACDPVVSNLDYTFVTLRSGNNCGSTDNVLEVYDTEDFSHPTLVNQVNLNRPIGMGLYDHYLFVCDDSIKVFDISNPATFLQIQKEIGVENAHDVIIQNDFLYVISENHLHKFQLHPNNIQSIELLSVLDF